MSGTEIEAVLDGEIHLEGYSESADWWWGPLPEIGPDGLAHHMQWSPPQARCLADCEACEAERRRATLKVCPG